MDIARLSGCPDLFRAAGWQQFASRRTEADNGKPQRSRRRPAQIDGYRLLADAMREIKEGRRHPA